MWRKWIIDRWWLIVFACVFGAARFLRFYALGARTIHIDEGMGLRFGQLFYDGMWRYNPYNSHGPIYFMYASIVYGLFGDSLIAARAAICLVSLLWLVMLLKLYWHLLAVPGRLVLVLGLALGRRGHRDLDAAVGLGLGELALQRQRVSHLAELAGWCACDGGDGLGFILGRREQDVLRLALLSFFSP